MLSIIYIVGIFATIHITSGISYNSKVYAEERSKDLSIFAVGILWPLALAIATLSGIFVGMFYSLGFILRVTGLAYIEHMIVRNLPKKYKVEKRVPEDMVEKSKRILIVNVNNTPPEFVVSSNPEFKDFGIVVAVDEEEHTFKFIINRLTNDTTTVFNLDDFDKEMNNITSNKE